jgi:hypothetical protein
MAKPDDDNFLGMPAAFNKVGGRAVAKGEEADTNMAPPAPSRNSPKTALIIVVVIFLAAVLIYVGEGGLGGVTHTHGRGGNRHGVSTEDADKAKELPRNF